MKTFSALRGLATFFLLSFLLISCSSDRLDVDVSHIEAEVDIKRLDRALFDAEEDSMDVVHQKLHQEYGTFYKTYVEQIIREGAVHDPMIGVNLELFVNDVSMGEVYDAIQQQFPDLSREEKAFEQAFQHYKYYFPDSVVPEVIAYHSGFNYKIFPTDSALGIGLEWYLGPEHDIIQRLPPQQFPSYQREKMDRHYMVTDAVKGWLLVHMQGQAAKSENLLGQMVFYGKVLYLMDALMPDTPDSLKIGYGTEEIAWCREHEERIWQGLVDKEVFFTNDMKTIRKYVMEAPFTTGMPKESPGRVGRWVGWQIVRAYMKDHPKVSLPRLIGMEAPERILKSYKPDRNS